MTVLVSLFAFIIAIGLIVSFHEFGHFWVARRLGVKVLRYSIGFGKPLWRRRGKDGIEYVIAAIPLGGYVKMLDEREGVVEPQELDKAFNRKSLGVRTAVVAAGPLFNFILAVVLYHFMFMIGVSGTKPIVDEVIPNSVAERSGVIAGDQIIKVAGNDVHSWKEAAFALLDVSFKRKPVEVIVGRGNGLTQALTFDIGKLNLLEDANFIEQLGMKMYQLKLDALIGEVLPGTGAEEAQLRQGDYFVSFDGYNVEDWASLVKLAKAYPGQNVSVGIIRDGSYLDIELNIGTLERDGEFVGYMGIRPHPPSQELLDRHSSFVRYGVFDSFQMAIKETWTMTVLTLQVIKLLLMGEAPLESISGPVSIAEYAGLSLLKGLATFLGLLGLLSISIGILNLLPIPLLDGGHLMYYLIEFFKGKPLSMQSQLVGQWLGMFMLGCLMCLALYNDFNRLFN